MPASSILFFTDGIKYSIRDQAHIRKWLTRVARTHRKDIRTLNYILVSDKRLLEMNKAYLDHNTLTDIITFPGESARGEISGEIYISLDRIKENAHSFGQPVKTELHRVMAHGLLHLCGFKDKTSKEQLLMRKQEEKALDLRTF